MGRKSKQPGGHNPLTYHERKRLKSSGYGTQSTRLTTAAQLPFGNCCLNLSPICDGVATPSGHLYEREAIMSYLLAKNAELREQRAAHERSRLAVENRRAAFEEEEARQGKEAFVRRDQGAMATAPSRALVVARDTSTGRGAASAASTTASAAKDVPARTENSLAHISYWLPTSQPKRQTEGAFDYLKELQALPPPPPERPQSPMSGAPLRLKQLIPLTLVREGSTEKKSSSQRGSGTGQVLCAVSLKAITTQPAVAIKPSGQVMLAFVYEELVKPTMVCPVTEKKIKEKDVLMLVKGRSGFAASGEVVAKKYNPTLT